jgi:hypothetical protein
MKTVVLVFMASLGFSTMAVAQDRVTQSQISVVGPAHTYKVSVVCDLPAAIAAGKYDYVDGDIISANFPEVSCKPGKVEVTLVTFDRDMTTEEVVAELLKRGLRPATLLELLALGAAQPELQNQLIIVALGSGWRSPDGNVYVPVLGEIWYKRDLDLYWNDSGGRWDSDGSFLAVRKTTQTEPITPPPAAKVDQSLPPDTYRVNVICDLPAAIAAGKYDYVDGDIISANFPEVSCKPGKVEVTLVTFDRDMTTGEVVAELLKRGLRPATLLELLALGAAQPELQNKLIIVAFGSGWRGPGGFVYVPSLDEGGGGRNLRLRWGGPGYRWHSGGRFLVVRK